MPTKLDRYKEIVREEHRRAKKLVERIGVDPGMALVKDARRGIEDRIASLARAGKSGRFTHQMLVATRAQLDDALAQLHTQLKAHARDSLNTLAEHAAENTIDVLHSADDLFTGIVTPLPIMEASYLRYVKAKSAGTLLRQYKSSLKRYGSETIESIERIMSRNLLAKAPAMDTMKEIAGEIGLGEAYHWKAERIFRTESASAYGRANAITIREAKLILPDMGKRWVAGPDPCDACADLDGTTVDESEEFVAVLGKKEVRVFNNPLHPHCVCTVVPWREAWSESEDEEYRDVA